jgi:hypothetical protein
MVFMSRKNKDTDADQRSAPRSSHDIGTTIEIFGDGQTWNESAHVTSLSRNGAGFSASRECTVGRLVRLAIPMPPALRAYDESEDIYSIMGIVQHCSRVSFNDSIFYQVGVALIGKKPPESFEMDPLQNYRVCGMSDDGLWNVTTSDQQFKGRKAPRFSIAIDVTLGLIQADKRSVTKEATVTKNISAGGCAVVSKLNAQVGDKVKFACKEFNFYALATVRDKRDYKFGPTTLHLEFIEMAFPVGMLPNTEFGEYAPIEQLSTNPQVPVPPPTADGANFEFERFQF